MEEEAAARPDRAWEGVGEAEEGAASLFDEDRSSRVRNIFGIVFIFVLFAGGCASLQSTQLCPRQILSIYGPRSKGTTGSRRRQQLSPNVK